MQWSDVTKAPTLSMLRQFGGLSLAVFGGLAAWRAWHGQADLLTIALAVLAVSIGIVGLIAPALVKPVFVGWMFLAFPIGWTISRLALGVVYFIMFAGIALVFRLLRRDVLHLKRGNKASYWTEKSVSGSAETYLRQF